MFERMAILRALVCDGSERPFSPCRSADLTAVQRDGRGGGRGTKDWRKHNSYFKVINSALKARSDVSFIKVSDVWVGEDAEGVGISAKDMMKGGRLFL